MWFIRIKSNLHRLHPSNGISLAFQSRLLAVTWLWHCCFSKAFPWREYAFLLVKCFDCWLDRHANLLLFNLWFIYVKTFFLSTRIVRFIVSGEGKFDVFLCQSVCVDHFSTHNSERNEKSKSRKSHTNLRSRTDNRENVTPQWKINFVNDSIATSATELHFGTISLLCVFSFRLFFSSSPN